jgi:hypothetical protein
VIYASISTSINSFHIAVENYFKKFKHRVPPAIGHMKPRDLARILHQLDRL